MSHLLLFEKGVHELGDINGDLLGKLVVPVLNLVLALGASLSHLFLHLLKLILLLLFQLSLLLRVLLLDSQGELHLELLLHLRYGFILRLSVLLQKLFNLVVFLLLELFEFLFGLVHDLFHLGVDHQLLHLESHLRLEAQTPEFTLGQSDG